MTHKKPRQPFIGSGRTKEGGFLATHKQDFNAHHTGTAYRHGAHDTDMEPPISTFNGVFYAPDVQETLEKIANYLECIGEGFITIGDGYGAACDSNTINVGDAGIPDIETAFSQAFANDRLQNGGIILLKAGTYRIKSPITIPSGISVMGEIAGTTVIGEMTEQPMFIISRATNRPITADSGNPTIDATDRCRFFNMTFFDNLDGYVKSGGVAIPTMITVPMIQCERGSNFSCEQVTFIGRMGPLGAVPPNGRDKTLRAIGYSTTAGSASNSVLHVENCMFDNMATALDFNATGSDNSLNVSKCRARTFGDDLTIGFIAEKNCFLSFNRGDVRLVDNHYVGSGLATSTCYTVTGTGVERLVVIGTTGGQTEINPGFGVGSLLRFGSTVTSNNFALETVFSANNWAAYYDKGYVYFVGDGQYSIGDITGKNALEFVRQSRLGGPVVEARVAVGEYNISTLTPGGGVPAVPIIITGQPQGASYPVISLATAGNFEFGYQITGVHFRSTAGSGANFSGVKVNSFDGAGLKHGGSIIISDCIFEDVSLILPDTDIAVTNIITGSVIKSSFRITSCKFRQTNTYDDFFSLIFRGHAHNMSIKDCHFSGNGYAFFATAGTNIQGGMLEISNTTFALDGLTIDDLPPEGFPAYIYIDGTTSSHLNFAMNNCKVLADKDNQEYLEVSRINAALTGATDIVSFVYIDADVIRINGCEFAGPHQSYTDSGTDYALPTLLLVPRRSLWFDNSRVMSGALPLQVASGLILEDSDANHNGDTFGIHITNSQFRTSYLTTTLTMTLLDIDYDLQAMPSVHTNQPKIYINNCKFQQSLNGYTIGATTNLPVYHYANTGTYYDTQGIVQVYASWADITISNCEVAGHVSPQGAADGSDPGNLYNNFAGIVVDGYHGTAAGGTLDGSWVGYININNNHIDISSGYDRGDGTNYIAAALYHVGYVNSIKDNYLGLFNAGLTNTSDTTATPNTACSLYINPQAFAAEGQSNTSISGNIFSRRTLRGGPALQHSHKVTTVYLDVLGESFADSPTGLVTDNVFTDTTVSDATAPMLTELQVAGPSLPTNKQWVIERNINQVATATVTSQSGTFSIGPVTGSQFDIVVGTPVTAMPSGNYIRARGGIALFNETANFVYTEDASTINAIWRWRIDLNELLPTNVQIISLAINVDFTSVFNVGATQADSIFELNSGLFTVLDTIDMKSPHPGGTITHSLVAGTDFQEGLYTTIPGIPLILSYYWVINDNNTTRTTANTSEIFNISVVYKW